MLVDVRDGLVGGIVGIGSSLDLELFGRGSPNKKFDLRQEISSIYFLLSHST